MAKKVRKLLACALALVTCFPLAACGTGVSVYDAGTADPSAYESTTAGADQTVSDGSDPVAVDAPTGADATADDVGDAVAESEWISWLAQIWADGSAVAAPSTYVRTENPDGTLSVEISDANALAYFSHDVYANADDFVGAEVKLTADIDLRNELWIPIGFETRATDSRSGDIASGDTFIGLPHAFKGTFDGGIYETNNDVPVGSHKISGLDGAKFIDAIIEDAGELYVSINNDVKVALPHNSDPEFHYGLFGAVGNATFKNLTITDFTFDFSECDVTLNGKALIADSIGAIAGYAGGSLTIENCVAGTERRDTNGKLIKTADVRGVACAGGLVGRAYPGYHEGAWGTEFGRLLNVRNADGSKDFQKNDSGQPVDSKGNVITDPSKIVYYADDAAKQPIVFDNCTNYLNIGVDGERDKKAGILGYSYWMSKTFFDDCTNYGDMHGQDVGGVTSYTQDGGIDVRYVNCTNYGDIYSHVAARTFPANGEVGNNIGGIAGRVFTNNNAKSFVIEKCVNYGNIHGEFSGSAGGVFGRLDVNSNASVLTGDSIVEDCFNYGNVRLDNKFATKESASRTLSKCGGVFGYLRVAPGSTVSCGNSGNVICNDIDLPAEETDRAGYVGGCVGYIYNLVISNAQYTQIYMINANSNVAKKVGNQ